MDFLKTLLLYMTVTMATAVQNGPLPADVPMPTAAPTAQVEQATAEPEGSAPQGVQVALPEEAATPEAQSGAEPSPTITPNRHYQNIAYGDRGNSVKKLQERLIELGYLPEGSADGAFGYQTNRAVREFQGNNGLSKDGVAGPATLTKLYEDPDVVALTTPTPELTATPEPEPDASLTIAPPEGEDAPDMALTQAPVAEVPMPQADAAEAPAEVEDGPLPGLVRMSNASIVLGDSGSRLAALRLSDGVMQPFYPRVWRNAEGAVVVSLRDMAESVNAWTLQIEDGVYTLEAAGYVVVLTAADDGGITCTVDGVALDLTDGDAQTDGEDVYVTADFLKEALKANAVWDADESTLMLTVVNKEAAQAND